MNRPRPVEIHLGKRVREVDDGQRRRVGGGQRWIVPDLWWHWVETRWSRAEMAPVDRFKGRLSPCRTGQGPVLPLACSCPLGRGGDPPPWSIDGGYLPSQGWPGAQSCPCQPSGSATMEVGVVTKPPRSPPSQRWRGQLGGVITLLTTATVRPLPVASITARLVDAINHQKSGFPPLFCQSQV
ncbi:hypothetical protein Syun_016502 [Stephania yunnanensis]|uniref:Uncharacterized protein n=1 Tax=Stephania yunnanensis TaxID=152371 RepID=A0AAP0P3Z2_9MAGN